LESFHRLYLTVMPARAKSMPGFEKKWNLGLILAAGMSVVAVMIVFAFKGKFAGFLQKQGLDPDLAAMTARFSLGEDVWFVVFLMLSAGVMIFGMRDAWKGSRWVWVFAAAVLIVDLGRADKPWVQFFDYKEQYASNPVMDFLKEKPYEHRVIARLSPAGSYDISGSDNFAGLCQHWLENDFPYHDIQTLDIAQMPRMPVLDHDYMIRFLSGNAADWSSYARLWQLTNTRYIIASAGALPLLNQRADPSGHSFRVLFRLDETRKPVAEFHGFGDLTVERSDQGAFALIEYTNALPRAKLFANWQTPKDDPATLETLVSKKFNPAQTVLIAKETPAPRTPADPNADPGTVTITDYQPKDIKLQASAKTPAVLLFNDRTGPYWTASIDGVSAPVLRCNFIMRGVFLSPGEHVIEFRFQPPLMTLYITMCGWGAGILLGGFVIYSRFPKHSKSGKSRKD